MSDAVRAAAGFLLTTLLATLLQWSYVGDFPGARILHCIDIPLSMVGVYFHEISHGIGALLSGGHFLQMQLAFGQGGLADVDGRGFSNVVTIFCGYLGPSVWGLAIYGGYLIFYRRGIDYIPHVFMGFVLLTMFLWARDIRTIGILVFIAAVFQMIGRLDSDAQLQWSIRFLSTYLVVRGFLDSYIFYTYLETLDPEIASIWDGQALADLTMHGELFWVHCWMACGAVAYALLSVMEIIAYRIEHDESAP